MAFGAPEKPQRCIDFLSPIIQIRTLVHPPRLTAYLFLPISWVEDGTLSMWIMWM